MVSIDCAWRLIGIITAVLASALGAATSGAELTVPPGFVVERVAGPPLVDWPMMAGFDDRGRLFVCDSSGFNLLSGTSEVLVKNPPHMIRMLEDTDRDGRFDKSTVFADKMTFPMGALWHDGALYTASAPSLWRLEGPADNGTTKGREEFVTKFDFGGNACDVHGPFLGPDGRIYWANCQRAFALPRAEGGLLKGKAAGVFRILPDGKELEMLCAGGMDNPVEVAFTAEGEALATVNLLIGNPRPRTDGIIHCVEGGVFPYRELDRSFKRTGDLLPPAIDLGWVAPAGLMRYHDHALGAKFQDNLFSCQFNTRRVVRHVIERHGASFRGTTEDFLVSSDPDFHPTDVLEDADGSLLIVDTGGWFLRGCPTSQIAKPEIKGGIYRVRRSGSGSVADPRGLAIAWDSQSVSDLSKLLNDPRWVVRDRAVHELGKRGADAVPIVEQVVRHADSIEARRNALWALTRIDIPVARTAVRIALSDTSESVRLTAVNSVALWRDQAARGRLEELAVSDEMPAIRREAATALGRIGQRESVPALLKSIRNSSSDDRFLEHAQIYALIQIDDRSSTVAGLSDASSHVRRAALLALDQMESGGLTRELVVPLLESSDAELQRAALTIAISRQDWADAVAKLLRQWLTTPDLAENNKVIIRSALAVLSAQPSIQAVVSEALASETTPLPLRLLLLEAIAEANAAKLPPTWSTVLAASLNRTEQREVLQTLATLRARNETGFDDQLVRLSKDARNSDEIRLAALAAVAPRLTTLEPELFDYLRSQLDARQPVLARLAAASTLGHLRLTDDQLSHLTASVAAASDVELGHLLAAFEKSRSPVVGKQLIAALAQAPGLESLSPDTLDRTLKDYSNAVREAAGSIYTRLNAGLEKQRSRLTELEPVLSGGNKAQGRTIFNGAKAACAACHTVAGVGGKIGPDLSKIGGIRTPRDLLESIVFPSTSFVRGYESFVVATTDGRTHAGLLQQATADALTLVTTERTVVRLPRASIDEIQPSRVSIMPQGLDRQLSRQELSDLIAYLASLK